MRKPSERTYGEMRRRRSSPTARKGGAVCPHCEVRFPTAGVVQLHSAFCKKRVHEVDFELETV